MITNDVLESQIYVSCLGIPQLFKNTDRQASLNTNRSLISPVNLHEFTNERTDANLYAHVRSVY